ncbi:MAG: TonB-dependent receptor [Pseudomonadota bacterium]
MRKAIIIGAVVGVMAQGSIAEEAQPEQDEFTDSDDLDTISVTATRVERATKDVAAPITVVDEKRIESAKMFNIKDAIQGTPGVTMESKNGGYDARLIIRGAGQKANYGVREIAVIRDGVPMTDPDSFSRFDFIDTQDIERIEIMKGPGSIYGGGSAGGTLQIISKSVFDEQINRLRLGLGNYDSQNLHFRYGGQINENNFYSITGSHRKTDNDWRHWNEFESNQLSFKHGLILDDGSTLETELSYTEADIQLAGSMDADQFEEFKKSGEQKDNGTAFKHSGRYSTIWFFNSRLEKQINDNLLFKPRIYFNHWDHFHPVTGAINDNPGTNVFGTDLEFVYNHELFGPSELVAGVTARVDDTDGAKKYEYLDTVAIPFGRSAGRILRTLSDRPGDLLSTEDTTNTLMGVYAQETIHPIERLTMDLSIRFDQSEFDIHTEEDGKYDYASGQYVAGAGEFDTDKTFNLFSGRLGATYAVTDQINLFGLIAQSDQVPSDSEIKKNTELDASTTRNYEVGLKGRAENWSFDLSLYHMKVSDEIVSYIENDETLFANAGKTTKNGLEFAGRVRLPYYFWLGFNYSHMDYKYDDYTDGRNDYSGNYMPYMPRNQYSVSLDYAHPNGFRGRLQADTYGSYYMDSINSGKYEGYEFLTSLMLAYDRGPHSLALNVGNLFDEKYAVEAKRSNAGTPYEKDYYSAGERRNAMLTYTYSF